MVNKDEYIYNIEFHRTSHFNGKCWFRGIRRDGEL